MRYDELRSELSKPFESLDIKKDNTGKYFWSILEGKTASESKIKKRFPVHKRILELYHSAKFPHIITNQKYNEYLKELLKEVGIKIDVTSHTIRRSFCTNMFNQGYSFPDIMQYSGHSTEKQLRTYIRVKNVIRDNSIPTE